jgi:hypothetical protein
VGSCLSRVFFNDGLALRLGVITGRIESVQLVLEDGRPACEDLQEQPSELSVVASRRPVTLQDSVFAEALPRLLNPDDLQTCVRL